MSVRPLLLLRPLVLLLLLLLLILPTYLLILPTYLLLLLRPLVLLLLQIQGLMSGRVVCQIERFKELWLECASAEFLRQEHRALDCAIGMPMHRVVHRCAIATAAWVAAATSPCANGWR